jgi:nitrite reductase (NO-forming)
VNVPGTFVLVDHALTRAFNKGALGQLKVTGEEDKALYSGKIRDEVYLPEGTGIKVTEMPSHLAAPAKTKAQRITRGEQVFKTNCVACHQITGQGIPGAFPPLANSDFLNGDKVRAIRTVTGGRQGKIIVNGKEFNGVMPAWTLNDEDIANVLTYVYNSWGNSKKEVTPQEVKAHRAKPGENKNAE